MSTAGRAASGGRAIFEREQAAAEWQRAVPAAGDGALLAPGDIHRLLLQVEVALELGSAEALARLQAETYRLAAELGTHATHETILSALRDGLALALAPALQRSPALAPRGVRILDLVSDAVWEAYADSLLETIQRHRYERLQQELLVAKRIQERLLPRAVPEIPGFDIAGRVLPAAEVGGDYWSCKSYPEDDIVTLKLADVTGHGVAAATLVAAVKFISGGYYRGSKTAAQVMARTNTVLVRETPHDILIPMVYGWLYPHSGEMSVVNAGHSPVLHYHAGSFRAVAPTGPALGLMETRYTETRLVLAPGDLFVTCSDGVTAPGPERALGEEWVRDQSAAGSGLRAAELVEKILSAALAFYGEAQDDMSILVVKRTA